MTAWMLGGEEGSCVLVTRTGDVADAKRQALADPVLVADIADTLAYDDEGEPTSGDSIERAARWLDSAMANVEYGRFQCNEWSLYEGYKQMWVGWSAEGRERAAGETTAVRFTEPERSDFVDEEADRG